MKNSTDFDRRVMSSSRRRLRLLSLVLIAASLAACGSAAPAAPAGPNPKHVAGAITFSSLAPDVYSPCGLAVAGDAVWVLACSGKAVKVGSGGERVARAIDGELVGLDALASDGDGSLLVLVARGSGDDRRGALVPLDAVAAETKGGIDLGSSIPMHAAYAGGNTWVAGIDGGLFRVDGATADRVAGGPPLLWIATDGTKIWSVAENGDVVERSADGGATKTFSGVLPNTIAAAQGEGSVWLAAATGVVRLDTSTGTATRVDVAGTVNHIETCGGSVWLSQPDFGLRSVDSTGKVLRSIKTSEGPSYLACDGSTLWILTETGSLGSIIATT